MSRRRRHRGDSNPSASYLEAVRNSRDRKSTREISKRILIVCEDQKSSPNYFRALVKEYRLSAAQVEVVSADRSSPLSVVTEAKARQDSARQSEGTLEFDEVWCVIDGDYGKQIPPARTIAANAQINLAVSTQCFEFWLLLHFADKAAGHPSCEGHIRDLKKFVNDYQKGSFNFSEIVKNVGVAAKRAKMKRDAGKASGNTLPEDDNPCSDVYSLIESLKIL